MKPKQTASRFVRTMRTLLAISALGIGLGLYNAYTHQRDTRLALGPPGEAQRRFFVSAAERPDLEVFFKGLEPEERTVMARNVGQYNDAVLAQLIGKVLGDFYAPARQELTESLAKLAQSHPQAVAEQLKLTGSFQTLGVLQALSEIGPKAVPMVVKQLEVADARTNAVAFLVQVGRPATPNLIATLNHKDVDVRKAAADALSKIGAPEAVEPLTRLYRTTTGEEQVAYLAALSVLGDPRSEGVFVSNVDNESYPLPRRSLAALGLGRIGSPSAAEKLWQYANHPDLDFQAQIISALQLAGNTALQSPKAVPALTLRVAHRVETPFAQGMIASALRRNVEPEAIRAAEGRKALVPLLVSILRSTHPEERGDVVDAVVQTLGSTDAGQKELLELEKDPRIAGFVLRRKRISG